MRREDEALLRANCRLIYIEGVSDTKSRMRGFNRAVAHARYAGNMGLRDAIKFVEALDVVHKYRKEADTCNSEA